MTKVNKTLRNQLKIKLHFWRISKKIKKTKLFFNYVFTIGSSVSLKLFETKKNLIFG